MIPYGHQWIDEKDIEEVVKVLRSDWLTTGPKVSEFENAICEYLGCKYSIAVNSGTSALDIAVGSLDLPAGSEVITTPFTFAATSNCLLYNRLEPVFADIDKDTRNIDPNDIRRKITSKTRAIIYVDFAGHPCDIDEIKEIAKEHDLWLIEDACHAFGANYHGKKIGNFADLTVFSFHPVKPITTGEGGAVVTDNPELAEKIRLLRNHGIDKDAAARYGSNAGWAYDMKILGRNYRMTDIQAALGVSQLKKIDLFIEKRNELASCYRELLQNIESVSIPTTKNGVRHGWHIYTVLLEASVNRDELFKYLRIEKNIGANVHYIPVYRHSYYQEIFGFDKNEYPVTEDVFKRIITLPLHPGMEEKDVEYITSSISDFVKNNG